MALLAPGKVIYLIGGFAGQLAFGDAQCSNSQEQLSGNETELIGCVNYVKDASGISNFFTRTPSLLNNANMLIFYCLVQVSL